jgi:chlorite dismutase
VTDGPPPTPATYYTLWAVLRRGRVTASAGGDLSAAVAELPPGVELRGVYDVSALRADADLMLWLTGGSAEALQRGFRILRRTAPLEALDPTWNALGVHRDAEFSRDHLPAFAKGLPPKAWLCVYPFVRSYEWYLLPDDERRALLSEHGRAGSTFPQVQANTVASFALGDYEWILALEADDPIHLVDLMRHLRGTGARRHVREEIPFFTGRRIELGDIAEVLA